MQFLPFPPPWRAPLHSPYLCLNLVRQREKWPRLPSRLSRRVRGRIYIQEGRQGRRDEPDWGAWAAAAGRDGARARGGTWTNCRKYSEDGRNALLAKAERFGIAHSTHSATANDSGFGSEMATAVAHLTPCKGCFGSSPSSEGEHDKPTLPPILKQLAIILPCPKRRRE